MKKVKRRSYAALLLALALLGGLGLFTWRFVAHGRQWVNFSANRSLYQGGRLVSGIVLDRKGAVLADGKRLKKNSILSPGTVLTVELPEPEPAEPLPQNLPLDVVYEDSDLIVVNKPRGIRTARW